jgi:hypothetical protein
MLQCVGAGIRRHDRLSIQRKIFFHDAVAKTAKLMHDVRKIEQRTHFHLSPQSAVAASPVSPALVQPDEGGEKLCERVMATVRRCATIGTVHEILCEISCEFVTDYYSNAPGSNRGAHKQ